MIQTIIILGILHTIYHYIFKSKYNTLNCGIFGMATNSPKKINSGNIKILGMANESRGKDSCGITIDGEIYYGLDKEKKFSDFMKGRRFEATKFPIVFGHTRAASVGIVNSHNAHPFGYGDNADGDYKEIYVHNGTLSNHKELAKKYDIPLTEKVQSAYNEHMMIERDKIDSEILGEILYKTKKFNVLKEYIGRAALVWTDTDEPNVIYLWSGKSKLWDDLPNSVEEERPMNVWIESKNTFYFSSLPESLCYIGANIDDVFQIEYNTVYKVTNGDFKKAEKTFIDRSKCFINQTTPKTSKYAGFGGGYYSSDYYYDDDYYGYKNSLNQVKNLLPAVKEKTPDIINIFSDTQEQNQNDYKGRIYTKKLRYFRNGILIKGICCYIKDYGFYQLGETYDFALTQRNSLVGKAFKDGDFDTFEKSGSTEVPFKEITDTPSFFYFIEGVLLKTKLDYEQLFIQTRLFKKGQHYDYLALSHASQYPVMEYSKSYKFANEQGIVKDGELFTGTIHGLLFEKKYKVKDGNLIAYLPLETTVTPVKEVYRYDEKILQQTKDFLKEFEYNIEIEELHMSMNKSDEKYFDNLEKEIKSSEDVTEIIENLINEEFAEPLDKLFTTKDKIDKYLPHPSAKEASRIIDGVIKLFKEFTK